MSDSSLKNYHILEPTTVGGIVSNAWRAIRYNFKFIAPPFFFIALLFSILIGINKDEDMAVFISFFDNFFNKPEIYLLIILIIAAFSFKYTKIFFNIITNQSTKRSYFKRFMKANTANLIKISLLLVVEVVLLTVINLFILFLFFLIAASIGVLFGFAGDFLRFEFLILFSYFFFLFSIFAFFTVIAAEIIILILQLSVVSIEEVPVRFSMLRALEIVFRDFYKFIKFSIVCMFLFIFLYINFHTVFFLFFIMLTGLIESVVSLERYTKLLESLSDIAGFCLTISILWPFVISTVTNFYYDSRIRKEGYDLEIHINHEKDID